MSFINARYFRESIFLTLSTEKVYEARLPLWLLTKYRQETAFFISVHLHMQMQRDTLQAQHRNLLVSSCSLKSGKLPVHLRKSQCHMGQFNYETWVCKHATDLSPFSSFHIAPDSAPHPPKTAAAGRPDDPTESQIKQWQRDSFAHTHSHSDTLSSTTWCWQDLAECKIKALTAHCNARVSSHFSKLLSPAFCSWGITNKQVSAGATWTAFSHIWKY